MGNIVRARLLTYKTTEQLMEELTNAIDEYQRAGYYVEIQYSIGGGYTSALIIVREKE